MEIIDQIKQTANIIEIASQYTNIIKRGKSHIGLCPFHSEKTPSFTLDIERQLYHCFGCGAGGDIFTLVMEKENLSFPDALHLLADKYNIIMPEQKKLSPQFTQLKEDIGRINELTMGFFRKNLFKTQEGQQALDYLHKRKISDEVIQKIKIGYALNSWDSLINYFSEKKVSPSLLEKAGLALRRQNKDGFYDRFRGRVIFPIFTDTGTVVAFGGRTLFDAEPKYLNSPDTPKYTKGKLLYGLNFSKEEIRKKEEIILVEGYTDFLSLYQSRIKNCAASLGTSLTADQVNIAHRFAPVITTCFDGDLAGRKASLRAISLCFEKGIQIKIMILPKGSDPDSFIQNHGTAEFDALKNKSMPALKYLVDFNTYKKDMKSPEVRTQIIRTIYTEIEKISDPILKSHYIKELSEYLFLDEKIIRFNAKQNFGRANQQKLTDFLPAEKRLLQIIFEDSQIAIKVFDTLQIEDFLGLKSAEIFSALRDVIKNKKTFNFHEFKQKLSPSLFSSLSEILVETGQETAKEEAMDCVDALKKQSLKKKWEDISLQIAMMEKKGETESLASFLKIRQEITEELSTFPQRN
ncbi:MAG: DNA primase [Candidatus Aminicenantes bacterium]|nr:DNA primase [Candidatus Aminicenantes bacterium]